MLGPQCLASMQSKGHHEEVLVTVTFDMERVQWQHKFRVRGGCSVLELKELMLQPKRGSRQDVDSFELQRDGLRLHDGAELLRDCTLGFAFLGREEGTRRASADAQSAPAWEAPEAAPELDEEASPPSGAPEARGPGPGPGVSAAPPGPDWEPPPEGPAQPPAGSAVTTAPDQGAMAEEPPPYGYSGPGCPAETQLALKAPAPGPPASAGKPRNDDAGGVEEPKALDGRPSTPRGSPERQDLDLGSNATPPWPHREPPTKPAEGLAPPSAVFLAADAPLRPPHRTTPAQGAMANALVLPMSSKPLPPVGPSGPGILAGEKLPVPPAQTQKLPASAGELSTPSQEEPTQGPLPPAVGCGPCIGDRVEAQYLSGFWYPVTIEAVLGDGSFRVEWEDGTEDDAVKCLEQLRLMEPLDKCHACQEMQQRRKEFEGQGTVQEEPQERTAREDGTKNDLVKPLEELQPTKPLDTSQAREQPGYPREEPEGPKAAREPEREPQRERLPEWAPWDQQLERLAALHAEASLPPCDVNVVVLLDTDLDLSMTLQMPAGSTVRAAKRRLVASGEMGHLKMWDFGLAIVGRLPIVPLPNSTVLTRATRHLCPCGPPDFGDSEFTLENALQMLRQLFQGFTSPEFQRSLVKLQDAGHPYSKYKRNLSDLAFTVQRKVLPRYGFEASMEGVHKMLSAYNPYINHEEVDLTNQLIAKMFK